MNVALWVVQGVLAAFFLAAGIAKITRSREKLAAMMPWVEQFSPRVVRLIGVAEVAGALGLVLPAATDIAPVLTPIAATGLGLLMVLAMTLHTRRKEPQGVVLNVILLLALVFVAWGRFGPYSLPEERAPCSCVEPQDGQGGGPTGNAADSPAAPSARTA